MIHIGDHNGQYVYEPTNNYLRSPEDGLRFHRSMNVNDVYDGPLDIATWNRPVIGPISDDKRWLVNPLLYDPTRPMPTHHAETLIPPNVMHHHYASPEGSAVAMGDYTAQPTDVDIGLLAELGQAVSRGAEGINEPKFAQYPGFLCRASAYHGQLGEIHSNHGSGYTGGSNRSRRCMETKQIVRTIYYYNYLASEGLSWY